MTDFGAPRRHVAQCGSTNDLARAWALDEASPAPAGALVTADFQTQGRGQRGNSWSAGFGQSALMSFVLRPETDLSQAGQLALVAGLAVADALASLGVEAQIKWPNDILLQGRKAAGTLVETSALSPAASHPLLLSQERGGVKLPYIAIVGIGINVNQERFVDAERFAYPPISLRLETGQFQDVETVIVAVARSLGQWAAVHARDGFPPILAACRARLAVGTAVRQREQSGILVELTDQGGARVCLPDGTFADWNTVEG